MTADDTLARTFAAREQTVPDADAEFAALVARLDRHGRRRQYRLAASGLAVAGLAAAVTVGVLLTPSRPSDQAAAPKPSSGSRWNWNFRYTPRPTLSVNAGWLPRGAKPVAASYYAGGNERRSWDAPYESGGEFGFRVSVAQWPDDGLPKRWLGSSESRDLTVDGHPARLFTSTFDATVLVDRGNGLIAAGSVGYDLARLAPTKAAAIAERMAATIEYGQRDAIPVKAELTAAPGEAKIVEIASGLLREQSTDYRLDDAETGALVEIGTNEYEKPLNLDTGLNEGDPGIALVPGKYPKLVRGKPGRPVQGHDTVVWSEAGRTVLFVKGLGGQRTKLTAGRGAETLADLYLLANGIRVKR